MLAKILGILAVLAVGNCYFQEKGVLALSDKDFPNVIQEFPFLLIQFYAPWCGHCKQLAPIYEEMARDLRKAKSPIRLAKIDADAFENIKAEFGVEGFPTLIFFDHGKQTKYNGARNKEPIINWLRKRTEPAIKTIQPDDIASLAEDGKVNVLFHGPLDSKQGKNFEKIAIADDYNHYYAVSGTDKEVDTVEIFRPFGQPLSTLANAKLRSWITQHERPLVFPFSQRTIANIFGQRQVGIILFHNDDVGESLLEVLSEAAREVRINQGKWDLIFTDIPTTSEHYAGLADYLKIVTPKSPVVLIDGGRRLKFVLKADPSELTSQQIVDFVLLYESGNGKYYKLDQEVLYDQPQEL